MPLNLFINDSQCVIRNINETSIITCGYVSIKDTIGRTSAILADKRTTEKIESEDKIVMHDNRMYVFEESFVRLDGSSFASISFKYPLYDHYNKIVGLFGCSILPKVNEINKIAQSLAFMANYGLLDRTFQHSSPMAILPGAQVTGIYLTKRESQCIKLMIAGKTAKMIAKALSLSPRTVEHYIERLKIKLNVNSKSELIQKFTDNLNN